MAAITNHVSLELREPELSSALRRVAKFAAGMTMPKTAVHKDSDSLPWENKVWFAKQGSLASPSGDLRAAQESNQP